MYMMFDPLYFIIVAPALILAIYAQIKVKRAMGKWSKYGASSGLTGAAAARRILDSEGLHDVAIEPSKGFLSDHYDPRSRTLRLSPDVYQSPSVAAVGVAAHEAGHALQHANKYAPLVARNAIVPMASVGSYLSWILIFGGFIMMMFMKSQFGYYVAVGGVLAYAVVVLFQIITLPVEFNASSRAKKVVFDLGIIQSQAEADGVAAVLNAAALTYVAATVSALLTLLYYALRLGMFASGDD